MRTGHAKKNSTVSAAQVLHKAVNGLWGDTSDMAKLLSELAVTAEAHAAHKEEDAIYVARRDEPKLDCSYLCR